MSDDCDWQKLHDDIQNSLRRNEEVMRDFSEWVDDQGS
jgi:hypothetical protein